MLEILFENWKKVLTVVIVGICIWAFTSKMSNNYFGQIESIQGVTKVNSNILTLLSGKDLIDATLEGGRKDSFESIQANDNVKGTIDNIEFNGKFNYITGVSDWIQADKAVVVTIKKYLQQRTYKIPSEKISIYKK